MSCKKYLFIDRDGTLIWEPVDFQIDAYEKFKLCDGVIPALISLNAAGYHFVMVTNQDGLGSEKYPAESFEKIQALLIHLLSSQGIVFEKVLICPHFETDFCECRKPRLGLVNEYLAMPDLNRTHSAVIGDRSSDLKLAEHMGIPGILYGPDYSWSRIARDLLSTPREARILRKTKETKISCFVRLDGELNTQIYTGIGFFDHMLEQLSKHGAFTLELDVKGDLEIDDHHTVEDTGIAIGSALKQALGEKYGIDRFGFYLPMDDASAQVALDLSGRSYFKFDGKFDREWIGGLATEMVPHFFKSFADGMGANLHLALTGENTHHKVESAFKAVGRSIRQAIQITEQGSIPSTKGVL